MNNLTSILTSPIAIIIYILALSIVAIYIAYCISKKGKQKRITKHNTMELKKLVSDVLEEEKSTKTVAANNMRVIKKKNLQVQEEQIDEIPMSDVDLLIQNDKVINELQSNEETANLNNNYINTMNNDYKEIEKQEQNQQQEEIETLAQAPVAIDIIESKKSEIENFYTNAPKIEEIKKESHENTNTEEVLQYTTIAPQEEEAKKELELLTEKLKQEEQVNSSNLIEHTDFEDEQEKNAIISLDELMDKAGELYEKNEETQYIDEGNEPISIQDLENQMKKQQEIIETIELIEPKTPEINNIETINISEAESNIKEEPTRPIYENHKPEKVTLDDFSSIKINDPAPKKTLYQETFKTSPVISPVYGITKNNDLYSPKTELELENTANYEKLDEEIRKTNQFIATLKELQNKLD